MKKLLLYLLCALLLAGCASEKTQTTIPTSTEPEATQSYLMETKILNVTEITPEGVLEELQLHNVLSDNVAINHLEVDGAQLNLDFNRAFADLVCSTGTAGEMMIIGSVVNTYLSAYQSSKVEYVLITVEGSAWESGHVIYDEPIGPME